MVIVFTALAFRVSLKLTRYISRIVVNKIFSGYMINSSYCMVMVLIICIGVAIARIKSRPLVV